MTARRALVIGGSRGIGRAIVQRLHLDGFEVLFTWHTDRESAEAVGLGRHFQLDLRDRKRPGDLVRELDAEGPIDALVCSAGLRRDGLLAMTSDADWEHVLDADLGGRVPLLPRRGAGHDAPARRRDRQPLLADGPARRRRSDRLWRRQGGIIGLTRSLAREVGRRGVRVNAVVPGYVATGLTADLDAEAVRALRAQECLPDGVQVESVAATVAFLLSSGASLHHRPGRHRRRRLQRVSNSGPLAPHRGRIARLFGPLQPTGVVWYRAHAAAARFLPEPLLRALLAVGVFAGLAAAAPRPPRDRGQPGRDHGTLRLLRAAGARAAHAADLLARADRALRTACRRGARSPPSSRASTTGSRRLPVGAASC
jgi:3-oxoacyl-[acyl-carrier protein] reductase